MVRSARNCLLAFLFPLALQVAEPVFAVATPVLEQRMLDLARQLRCLVCQNQTVADSHAELAVDLRARILEMMRDGADDNEILAFMTERYGDYILYRPPLKLSTLILWMGPALFVSGGFFVLAIAVKRRRDDPEWDPIEDSSDAFTVPNRDREHLR